MKTTLVAIAFLALAGAADAASLANSHTESTVAGIDPMVDGTHTLDVDAGTDAFGTPYADVLVDGQAPGSFVPAVPALPEAPAAPEAPSVPEAPSLPEAPAAPEVPSLPSTPALPALPSAPELPPV